MTSRDAREEGLPAVLANSNACITDGQATADLEPVSVESKRDRFREPSPRQDALWVWERGLEMAGGWSFPPFRGRPACFSAAEMGLRVSLDHRREEVGRTFLRNAVEQAPALDGVTPLALVFCHNAGGVSPFREFRFRQWDYLPRVARQDGIETDLVILGRQAS